MPNLSWIDSCPSLSFACIVRSPCLQCLSHIRTNYFISHWFSTSVYSLLLWPFRNVLPISEFSIGQCLVILMFSWDNIHRNAFKTLKCFINIHSYCLNMCFFFHPSPAPESEALVKVDCVFHHLKALQSNQKTLSPHNTFAVCLFINSRQLNLKVINRSAF